MFFLLFQTGLELLAMYPGLPQDLAEKRATYHEKGIWETHKGIKSTGDGSILCLFSV